MLRKVGIVLTVIALGMTAVGTDAFARGGGGGHGGGGHFGGGGGFGAGARMGVFAAGTGISGGHMAGSGRMGLGRGAFNSRPSGLRSEGRGNLRNVQGGWGGCNMPYDYRYQNCGSFF